MGEFKITHKYILDNDVRYMYSGIPRPMKYRGSGDYPNFDMLRIQKENSHLKKSVLKSTEYNVKQTAFFIPKAPAFRLFTRHKVDPVVERLLAPTIAREGFNAEKHREKFRCKEYTQDPDKSGFPSYKKVPEERVKQIVSRLLTPTHMSMLKQRLPPPPFRQDPNRIAPMAMPIVQA